MKKYFLIALMMAIYAPKVSAQNPTDANIIGHIIDSTTAEHLPYINIYLKGTTIGTTTDNGGHFHLTNCPEGEYTLVARGVGYKQAELKLDIRRGTTTELTIKMERDYVELEQVVITATQHDASSRESAVIVGQTSHERLNNIGAVNLAEGLNFGLGLRTENTCQNCGSNEMRINGLGGAYTQILIDSRPVNNALAGVYLMEQIPTAMIERVEVIRGGGSALYGGNAVAGVVNIITRMPEKNEAEIGSTLRLLGQYSTDINSSFGASVVSENRGAGIFVYGSYRERQPYDANADGFSEIGQLKNRMIGFRANLNIGERSRLTADYHTIHEFRRGGDRFDLPSPMAHISEGGEHDIHSGGLVWDLFGRKGHGHTQLYASAQKIDRQSYYGERTDDEPFGTSYGTTNSLTINTGGRYSYDFDKLLFMPATLTLGAEHTADLLHDHTYASDTTHQSINIGGIYAQNEWKDKRWGILTGIRLDRHSEIEKAVLNPRLSLRYNPTEHTVVRAGYSSGYRAPQIYDEDLHVGAVGGELYRISNATNLRTEHSHSLNASIDFCLHLGKVETYILMEGFYTTIENVFINEILFDDTINGYLHYERRNGDGANVRGINAELRTSPHKNLWLQIGVTWQKSSYNGVGLEWKEGEYEKRMERTPELYGYLLTNYSPLPPLDISLSGTYTGPMLIYHNINGTTIQTISQHFFDFALKMEYTFRISTEAKIAVSIGIQNILNQYQKDFDSGIERDSRYIYGPSLPRTLNFGARLKI